MQLCYGLGLYFIESEHKKQRYEKYWQMIILYMKVGHFSIWYIFQYKIYIYTEFILNVLFSLNAILSILEYLDLLICHSKLPYLSFQRYMCRHCYSATVQHLSVHDSLQLIPMWLPMIQSNLKVRNFSPICKNPILRSSIDFQTKVMSLSFVSICLLGCSCVSRPSRTEWTTSTCRAKHLEFLHLLCANGCSAHSSRWLRWRSSRLRPPRSSIPCDRSGSSGHGSTLRLRSSETVV